MTEQFTPGPWEYEEEDSAGTAYKIMHSPNYQAAVRNAATGAVVADIRRSDYADRRSREEARANARLIAAAPDLLSACEAELSIYDTINLTKLMPKTLARITTLRAAIAKARGD